MINVCIQGLGFVGAAMAIAVASARDELNRPIYSVTGVDIATPSGSRRVEAINHGRFPFETSDKSLSRSLTNAIELGNIKATVKEEAFSVADIVVVDVPFDINFKDDQPKLDFSNLDIAVRTIARQISPGTLILIETTVPPGTCLKVIYPILEQELQKRGMQGDEVHLAHSFERVMPGPGYLDSIINYWRVYAGRTTEAADACEKFLTSIINTEAYPLIRLPSLTASELTKVMENTYRAVNIAFIDEWTKFSDAVGIDLHEVIEAIRIRSTHSNIRTPGLGVGGYCLTKDPAFTPTAARDLYEFENMEFPFSNLAMKVNNKMPFNAFTKLKKLMGGSLEGKSILILGVSYRSEIGDTRFSPVESFVRTLLSAKARVQAFDPYLNYWPELDWSLLSELPRPQHYDVVVFTTAHETFGALDLCKWLYGAQVVVFDTVNVIRASQRQACKAAGIKVESLGRSELP